MHLAVYRSILHSSPVSEAKLLSSLSGNVLNLNVWSKTLHNGCDYSYAGRKPNCDGDR